MKRDKIGDLWPLMAAPEQKSDDIRKFEEIGTHPIANFLAIAEALTFHQMIGPARKGARMKYLTDVWVDRFIDYENFVLHTSRDLSNYLWNDHNILVTPIMHSEFEGIRVTPSVYTTMEELDRFSMAMQEVLKNGL